MPELDIYNYHEALDRAHVMNCIFYDHIVEHRAVKATPELKAKSEEIAEALGEFYQMCGSASVEFEDGKAE
jgi:hypothetical protein